MARPPGLIQRTAKWSRRHRSLVRSAVVVLCLLVVGLSASTVLIAGAAQRERAALAESRKHEAAALKQTQRARIKTKEAQQQHNAAAEAAKLAKAQEKLARRQRDLTLYNLYVAQMKLAHQDWQVGLLPRMLQTLDSHLPQKGLPDLRGWEWYYLASRPYQHKDVFDPDLGPIKEVAWNPDGRLVAIGGSRGVKVYEPISQQTVHAWSGLAGHPPLAWSPDGSRLAATSMKHDQEVIKIWHTLNWKELHALKRDVGRVTDIAWSPDGMRIASGSDDRTAKIWDARTGRELLTLEGHGHSVMAVVLRQED